jgi:hypothetical protein
MTGNDENISEQAIELCRNLNRSAAVKYAERGVSHEDITMGSIYCSFDLATGLTGSQIGAIEWLRSAVDVIERQLLEGETLQ